MLWRELFPYKYWKWQRIDNKQISEKHLEKVSNSILVDEPQKRFALPTLFLKVLCAPCYQVFRMITLFSLWYAHCTKHMNIAHCNHIFIFSLLRPLFAAFFFFLHSKWHFSQICSPFFAQICCMPEFQVISLCSVLLCTFGCDLLVHTFNSMRKWFCKKPYVAVCRWVQCKIAI